MRNPERIPELLNLIDKLWQQQSDTRFNQLIHNLWYEFDNGHDEKYSHQVWEQENKYEMRNKRFVDLFYVEDDEFISWLRKKVNDK